MFSLDRAIRNATAAAYHAGGAGFSCHSYQCCHNVLSYFRFHVSSVVKAGVIVTMMVLCLAVAKSDAVARNMQS